MVKLQQYYVFKVNTSFLKRNGYKTKLSLDDARRSGMLVSLGDSQMLRTLRDIKKIETNEEEISSLIIEQKKIKRKRSSASNSEKLKEIGKSLDEKLFVEDIISVFVDDVRHYDYIGKNGFYINGKKYKRFICGAGQARRNNAIFINELYENEMYRTLNNGRNENIEITPAKYSAYFGLASSSSTKVTTPRFCVVQDFEIKRKEMVDYIEEVQFGDDIVSECEKEITFNIWDGQGIISPEFAKVWSDDLGIEYIPSAFIIRANFIKGMVCTIDFHKYSEQINKNFITDIYGNEINVNDIDIILTKSQFKMFDAFQTFQNYIDNCSKNKLNWGVTRVTPKNENKYCFLNYQFIQVLKLNEQQIKNLSQKTLEYFNNVINGDIESSILYLLGKNSFIFDKDIFSNIHDNVLKAIILNNSLKDDPYVKNYLIKSLNKKIKESYIGNLLIDGQYTMMISDPYAFMEYVFGLPIKGLLKRGEYYNKYWIDKGLKKVAAMRSPLTYRSEINILKLKENEQIRYWYQYLNTGNVYNVFGNDCLIHGGSDFDGDIVCITNTKEIIDGAYSGLPIYYDTKKAPKEKINKDELYIHDIKGFNQKIGFVTNCATSGFALLESFKEDGRERRELIDRLKRFRKEQGNNIDATKGLVIKPFPVHWTKWKKVEPNMTPSEIEELEFQNKIVINKRPLFMRWLYSGYNKKYIDFVSRFDTRSKMRFNKGINEILNSDDNSEDENLLKNFYYKYNPFIETNCIMNNVSRYMESSIRQIKSHANNAFSKKNVKILQNKRIRANKENIKNIYSLYEKYKKEKRNFLEITDKDGTQKYKTAEQYNKSIRQMAYEFVSDGSEIANIAVDICYTIHPNDNKSFAWNVFGDEIVENVIKNKQDDCKVPFLHEFGEIDFLGNKYSNYIIDIKGLKDE